MMVVYSYVLPFASQKAFTVASKSNSKINLQFLIPIYCSSVTLCHHLGLSCLVRFYILSLLMVTYLQMWKYPITLDVTYSIVRLITSFSNNKKKTLKMLEKEVLARSCGETEIIFQSREWMGPLLHV